MHYVHDHPRDATQGVRRPSWRDLEQGPWEKVVPDDFQRLREEGRDRDHPLMVKVERLFQPAPPTNVEVS